jgi:hypothetical protein
LRFSHHNIGNVLIDEGKLTEALSQHRTAFIIRDRLTKANPGNAQWQRDLALSYGEVALMDKRMGERDRALGAFQQGRTILARLKERSPSDASLHEDLAWFDGQIAAMEK